MAALVHVRQGRAADVDLAELQAHLSRAMTSLEEFDEVGGLAGAAQKNLDAVRQAGAHVKARMHETLTASLSVLHP